MCAIHFVFLDFCVILPRFLIRPCFPQSLLWLMVSPKLGKPITEKRRQRRPNLLLSPCIFDENVPGMHGYLMTLWMHIDNENLVYTSIIVLWYKIAPSNQYSYSNYSWIGYLTLKLFLRGGAAFQSLNASKVIKTLIFCFCTRLQLF